MSSPKIIVIILRDMISLNSAAISITVSPSLESFIAYDHTPNLSSKIYLNVSIMPDNFSLQKALLQAFRFSFQPQFDFEKIKDSPNIGYMKSQNRPLFSVKLLYLVYISYTRIGSLILSCTSPIRLKATIGNLLASNSSSP